MVTCNGCKSNDCICNQVSNFFNENGYLMTHQADSKHFHLVLSLKKAFTASALAICLMACGALKGPAGANGNAGQDGHNGQDAVACTTTAEPDGVRITCPDGSTQVIHNGDNGADGSSIVMVQLCPNLGATVYGVNWPEFAYCIADKLFATYWDGSHAFTAYIPPGRYASTSPNGCTFEVVTGCQVVQL